MLKERLRLFGSVYQVPKSRRSTGQANIVYWIYQSTNPVEQPAFVRDFGAYIEIGRRDSSSTLVYTKKDIELYAAISSATTSLEDWEAFSSPSSLDPSQYLRIWGQWERSTTRGAIFIASEDISAAELARYGLGLHNSSQDPGTQEHALPAVAISKGEAFYQVIPGGVGNSNFWLNSPTTLNKIGEIGTFGESNAGRVLELFYDGVLIDTYGDYSGATGVFTNGWCVRRADRVLPKAVFDVNDWIVYPDEAVETIRTNNNIIMPIPENSTTLIYPLPSPYPIHRYRVVASSSFDSSRDIKNVIDGNLSNQWRPASIDSGEWAYLDLGYEYYIHSIILTWDVDGSLGPRSGEYVLQKSLDAVTWTTFATRSGPNLEVDTYNVAGTLATRYIRMLNTDNSSVAFSRISLREFEVFGHQADQISNVSLSKPVTATSFESGRPPDLVVDANPSTRWSTLLTEEQYLTVDLGGSFVIHRAQILWETAFASSYDIEVSTDGSNWTPIVSVTGGDGDLDQHEFAFTEARYIRIFMYERGSQYGYSIYEFEVYGSDFELFGPELPEIEEPEEVEEPDEILRIIFRTNEALSLSHSGNDIQLQATADVDNQKWIRRVISPGNHTYSPVDAPSLVLTNTGTGNSLTLSAYAEGNQSQLFSYVGSTSGTTYREYSLFYSVEHPTYVIGAINSNPGGVIIRTTIDDATYLKTTLLNTADFTVQPKDALIIAGAFQIDVSVCGMFVRATRALKDASFYAVGTANNGTTTLTPEVPIPARSMEKDEILIIPRSFSTANDWLDGAYTELNWIYPDMGNSGNDIPYLLHNNVVSDVSGDIGSTTDYFSLGWFVRNFGVNAASDTYVPSEWTVEKDAYAGLSYPGNTNAEGSPPMPILPLTS